MIYAQFYVRSTGYIPGTVPPKFDKTYVKPILKCGTDGVLKLDGRKTINNLVLDTVLHITKLLFVPIGFKIIKAEKFSHKGKVLFDSFKQDYKLKVTS